MPCRKSNSPQALVKAAIYLTDQRRQAGQTVSFRVETDTGKHVTCCRTADTWGIFRSHRQHRHQRAYEL